MASGVFYSAISGDDGYGSPSPPPVGLFNSTSQDLYIGSIFGESRHIFCRFPSINIPSGAVIDSACIKFTAAASESGTCNFNCYFNDIDSAVAPTSWAQFNALSLTSAIAWAAVPNWTGGVLYDTPELKTILQDVVDRAGWSLNNALMAVVKEDTGTVSKRTADSYDNGSGYPALHITWTATVYEITTTIPMPVAIINSSDSFTHIHAAATIPPMTAKLTRVPQIYATATIPMMTASITAIETIASDVSIPMTRVYLSAGIRTEIVIAAPMMTVSGQFGIQSEVTLPMMTIEMEGMVGRVVTASAKIPMMTAELSGKTEHLADGDVTIPAMRARAELMTGEIISGSATIPMMGVRASTYEDINGDIDVSVPMMEAYMVGTAERAACPVLRYTEPAL